MPAILEVGRLKYKKVQNLADRQESPPKPLWDVFLIMLMDAFPERAICDFLEIEHTVHKRKSFGGNSKRGN